MEFNFASTVRDPTARVRRCNAALPFGVCRPNQWGTRNHTTRSIQGGEGFRGRLVYEVPSSEQGSWVSLTVAPEGRLVASDQRGSLYQVDVSGGSVSVSKLNADIGSAQGLLFAFGSLYVNVNGGRANGVYRLTDTNGDGTYDKKQHVLPLAGGGEHGPHALILSQDGKRIITCAGNMTKLPENIARSRVPQVWDEDHLLGRMPDARGHAADRMAPGGWIGSFLPDGSDFELIATGFRNEYDIALDKRGELFSYDADMEWDVGTPWYRPTRVNHVISGAEFGWRNGTGKWPPYYPDSVGAAVDIGPGSPTGICFGYGTKFPAKYQNALFISDWSYGNIHAVHLNAEGSSYTGTYETFSTAAPLPATDLVVRPQDGALYFTIGGRGTQSGLYRIVYRGDEPTTESDPQVDVATRKATATRKRLEAFHHETDEKKAIGMAIRHLASPDRGRPFRGSNDPGTPTAQKVAGKDQEHRRRFGKVSRGDRSGSDRQRKGPRRRDRPTLALRLGFRFRSTRGSHSCEPTRCP